MSIKNRLWIFQATRVLQPEEEKEISDILSRFLLSWEAHGVELKSDFQILDNRFIVVSVDENHTKAGGCSIDSLNQCIRQIDAEYKLNLLNRLWVSYETQTGDIETLPINEFKEKVKASQLSPDTYIYNLSVSTPEEFEMKFKQPLKESWAKTYLNN